MPMISRVRRCASQRSSQANSMRARTMFTRAKVRSTIVAQGSTTRPGDSDADVDSEQPQAGHRRRRVQRSVSQADQKVRPVAQRETQKIRRLDILGKRRRHQGKKLPEKKHRPQQCAQPLRISMQDQEPRRPAQADQRRRFHRARKARLIKMREASSRRPRKVRRELTKTRQRSPATAASCWRACGTDRSVTSSACHPRSAFISRAASIAVCTGSADGLRRRLPVQPSHDNSWPSPRDPPTVSRKICSRVSFSPGRPPRRHRKVRRPRLHARPQFFHRPCATSRPR